MATTVGIFGQSGGGKTSSIFVDSIKGAIEIDSEKIELITTNTLKPETTFYINADKKQLPFPKSNQLFVEGTNMLTSSNTNDILAILEKINGGKKHKVVIIDTVNAIMIDYEMEESKKLTFDKWMDLAKTVYQLIAYVNTMRSDLVIYLLGHVGLYDDVDGNTSKCLVTNGRKLDKIRLESKLPVVLFTHIKRELDCNKYYFETQSNRSTAKSPVGMFKELIIPNSLHLVDSTIRNYYGIN